MTKITIYSKEGCMPCITVKRWLQMKGKTWHEIDVILEDKLEEVVQMTGFQMLPVVIVEKDEERHVVSGANLQRIAELL